MKRSPSFCCTSPEPSTPPKKRVKSEHSPSQRTVKKDNAEPGVFTTEKYAIFLERLITAGWANVDRNQLAQELGVTKKQLCKQMEPNRFNIRKRVMEWVRGI
ncbi:hypothetical protein BD324DRAFT_653499 [Kockovaella imperatae]|uniref:Uncharacterized protein n=1 Tax=Kockovaella imperatae TaxID=4999 RepID=A0A1Y1U896_9TREE|nr:hypothetical protein BD324DRAFT_653499 [Kockovaella imperatae]ORX34232.1 hypothetical protein BD324DRAFT_653499 [Kockovaella imperatae]